MHLGRGAARSVWLAGSIAIVWACGGSSETSTGSVCTPGATRSCSGPDACTGAQLCNDEGSAWGACDCRDGTGGSAGGTNPVCRAGQLQTCTGPNDCAGVRVCDADGTAYGACECANGGAAGASIVLGSGGTAIGGSGGTGGGIIIIPTGGTSGAGGAGGTGGEIISNLGGTSGTGGEIILNLGGTSGTGGFDSSECLGPDPPVQCADGAFLPAGPACGDGQINMASEWCDDGNTVPGDGCSGACLVEPNWECPVAGATCVTTIICGDSEISGAEVCDDGNTLPGDGCAGDCRGIEVGYECPTPGDWCISADTSTCGDAVVDTLSGEECDDGVNDGGYGECASGCRYGPRCGDGEVQTEVGELCDAGSDGNRGGYGECAPGCVFGPHCGDGVLQPGFEDCDDGNNRDVDGCSSACREEVWVPN